MTSKLIKIAYNLKEYSNVAEELGVCPSNISHWKKNKKEAFEIIQLGIMIEKMESEGIEFDLPKIKNIDIANKLNMSAVGVSNMKKSNPNKFRFIQKGIAGFKVLEDRG